MTKAADWLYARVLRKGNLILPRQLYWLGWVEFTPPNLLQEDIRKAITTSLLSYAGKPLEPEDKQHLVARTLVLDATAEAAMAEGEARLREAIEVLQTRVCPFPQELELSPAGALLDIVKDAPRPLRPARRSLPMTGGFLDDRGVNPPYTLNLLLAAPTGFGKLGSAYLRSLHWKQLAHSAATVAERILLLWMATEALCSETTGADPIPNLMYAAGFPIGSRARLAETLRTSVRNHRTWTKRIQKLLEVIKRTRNAIVHEGHRDIDIRQHVPSPDERDSLLFLTAATRCLHQHAESVLSGGAAQVAKLWSSAISLTAMRQNATWIVDHLEGKHTKYVL